ncbi:MAG: phage protein Gp36 family protein [Mangrovibacterium sp.]
MARFIAQEDYDMLIKQEIIKLLTAPIEWYNAAKLVRAENTAIDQIKNRIGKRYDCSLIFTPPAGEPEGADTRDQWMVTITIDIALYHLYSQTGMRDIPEHRANRYQDAIDWLKDVGNGTTSANLPELTDESGEVVSDVRIWGRELNDHKY